MCSLKTFNSYWQYSQFGLKKTTIIGLFCFSNISTPSTVEYSMDDRFEPKGKTSSLVVSKSNQTIKLIISNRNTKENTLLTILFLTAFFRKKSKHSKHKNIFYEANQWLTCNKSSHTTTILHSIDKKSHI